MIHKPEELRTVMLNICDDNQMPLLDLKTLKKLLVYYGGRKMKWAGLVEFRGLRPLWNNSNNQLEQQRRRSLANYIF